MLDFHGALASFWLYRFFHEYPLCLFGVLLAVWRVAPPRLRLPWRVASIALAVGVVAMAIAYTAMPVIVETGESQIAAAAYLAGHSQPLYPALDSVNRYAEIYGPNYYLLVAAFYRVFGANLFAAKLPGLLLLCLTLFAVWRMARHYVERREAILALGAVALLMARFGEVAYWIHPDPAAMACVAMAAWAATWRGDWTAGLTIGLCLGAAVNFKISAPVYFLPILAIRWRAGAIACAAAVPVACAPFLLPQVSLVKYAVTLETALRQPFDFAALRGNVQYALLFAFPALMAARFGWYAAALGAALLGACIAGSKPGAGAHHLLPMAAVLAQVVLRSRDRMTRAMGREIAPWAATIGLFSLSTFAGPAGYLPLFHSAPEGRRTEREISSLLKDYPALRVEMGYGESVFDRSTMFRPLLVFAGQPYTLDVASVMDMQLGGVAIPPATRAYLRACGTPVWLIPKSERPFDCASWFDGSPVFDEEFRRTFLTHYEKHETRDIFDVWTCRAAALE